MIKKILFTFLLAFICFFGIDKVYALVPYQWVSCDSSNGLPCAYNTASVAFGSNDEVYLGKSFAGNPKLIRYYYNNLNDYLIDGNEYYTLNFKFFSNQVGVDSLQHVAFTANGSVCSYGWSDSQEFYRNPSNEKDTFYYNTGSNFVVTCDNVKIIDDSLIIEFYQTVRNQYSGGEIAISENINFNLSSLSSLKQQQAIVDGINEQNKTLKETNETLNDDDTSESTSEATEFFEGFDTDTHGLTSIITAPLELIGNIAGSSCSPLPLQVPFVNKTMSLPCMSTIYKKHFGSFLTVYQTITFGIVAYWVCIRIFALVKDFKNPEHDEIEVMDL